MKHLIAAVLLSLPAAALAVPGGELGTLPLGTFTCELPGDATGPAGLRRPEADFTVINNSSYRTPQGTGTYLVTGDIVVLTAGPLAGARFKRITERFIRKLDDQGKETSLRCILRVANNG